MEGHTPPTNASTVDEALTQEYTAGDVMTHATNEGDTAATTYRGATVINDDRAALNSVAGAIDAAEGAGTLDVNATITVDTTPNLSICNNLKPRQSPRKMHRLRKTK
jgi:hypothetical protein